MSSLTAVHLTANNSLCVLYGDLALSVVDQNDQNDECQSTDNHQNCNPPLKGAVHDVGNAGDDGGGQTGDDRSKQDHGDTVANTELGDLLAQPHDQCRASGEGENDNDCSHNVAGCLRHQQAVVLDQGVEAEALQQSNCYGGVTGDGCDLLLAFLAAFLAQALQCRNCDAQKLNDNGSIDVGLNGQCEDGGAGESAAGHNVQQTEDGILDSAEVCLKSVDVDVGNRDGIAETIKQKDDQSEEDLVAELFDLPCITYSLEHLDHLCLSASRFDLLFCGLGESSCSDSELLSDFAVAKELDTVLALGNNACIQDCLDINNCAILELVENRNVQAVQRLSKNVVEASLGDTACQRHLAAFKADANAAAATCLLALMAAACGLAVTGGVASALALVDMGGAGYGRKFVYIHSLALLILR